MANRRTSAFAKPTQSLVWDTKRGRDRGNGHGDGVRSTIIVGEGRDDAGPGTYSYCRTTCRRRNAGRRLTGHRGRRAVAEEGNVTIARRNYRVPSLPAAGDNNRGVRVSPPPPGPAKVSPAVNPARCIVGTDVPVIYVRFN